jgi:superoxide dismutase, Fe-Mn family
MAYSTTDYSHLLGLQGFSDTALNTHLKLYGGYVANTNKLLEKLPQLAPDSPEYAELKRRFGWEFNGMRLHEHYFEAMSKTPAALNPASALYKQIVQDFGSHETWLADFKATASVRGIGWAILYHDMRAKKLINAFVNEHDAGHLSGCRLLLNLDIFEHAFLIDYGTNRAEYIEAFMNAVDWSVVEQRCST